MPRVILHALRLPEAPPVELRLFRDGWNDTTKESLLCLQRARCDVIQSIIELVGTRRIFTIVSIQPNGKIMRPFTNDVLTVCR